MGNTMQTAVQQQRLRPSVKTSVDKGENMNKTYNNKNFVVCSKCGHQIENVLEHVKYVLHGHCEHCAESHAPVHAELKRSS